MLSNDAVKLLKWLETHDHWMTPNEIEKDCKTFDVRDLKTLKDKKMVDAQLNMDDGGWVKYRISNSGKAYLEGLRAQRLPELREWLNTLLALIPFLAGVIFSDSVKDFFRWIVDWLS